MSLSGVNGRGKGETQNTEVGFISFLSSGLTIPTIVNPPEEEMVNHISVQKEKKYNERCHIQIWAEASFVH